MKTPSRIDTFMPYRAPSPFDRIQDQAQKKGPRILSEAFKNYGLKELPGADNSQEILDMAVYLGGVIEDFYTKDSIPWCGLAVSYWIKKSGFEPPKNYSQVRARDFAKWGKPVFKASLGDVMVFWRGSPQGRDGHVGLYVAEDEHHFYILGGNQSNEVNIMPLKKTRFLAARRCPWKWMQPLSVKPIFLSGLNMKLSENEA